MYEKLEFNCMKIVTKATCLLCGNPNAIIIEEPRYNGFRGVCDKCEGNWAES